MTKAHLLTIDRLIQQFNSNKDLGLSEADAQTKLIEYGYNELSEQKPSSWLFIFFTQFTNPLIYVLLAAAVIIFFTSEDHLDAFIVCGVIVFNALVGTIQEGRTESILESLKQMLKTHSIVIRNGTKKLIQTKYLVPGDLILLKEGERVPADARLISSHALQVDESMLTGESSPAHKITATLDVDVPLIDQKNMVFKGTYILSGSAVAIVCATGIHTEIGKVHTTTQEIKTEIPLKDELDTVSHWILIFILGLCGVLLIVGLLQDRAAPELLIMLTALFMCVVPEGLAVVLMLVLVSGSYVMAKHHVLVKNMQAIDGLGRADVIVTDKTGTLTRNEMVVSKIYTNKTIYSISGHGYHTQGQLFCNNQKIELNDIPDQLYLLATAASLLNNTDITYVPKRDLFTITGDPTEAALYVLSQKLGLSKESLLKEYQFLYEIPFNPELQYHAIFFKKGDMIQAFLSGAPEVIIRHSQNAIEATQALSKLLEDGLRVVALATKIWNTTEICTNDEYISFIQHDLTFLGLCGIQDTIRSDVASLVLQLRQAGIQVIMATGDHQKTAVYVATNVGILRPGDYISDGQELAHLTDLEVKETLAHTTVFSRVSPNDKLRIVSLLHQEGKVVAMTGDGINDAPSLAAADLGIAMGLIGTEVAKQSADIILLDDSFSNIVHAIILGRHIFYSIKRVVLYFFATNTGEIFIVLFALILNMPLPITAAQILWLNLVTDGFLNVALAAEPQDAHVLQEKQKTKKMRLVDATLLIKMTYMAFPMGAFSLALFWVYQDNIALARTITLMSMAFFQWFNALNCRSETQSVFQIGLFSNRWLTAALMFVCFLQLFIVYHPLGHHIFKTVPLSFGQWGLIIGLSSSLFIIEELRKLIMRSWHHN